MSENEAVCISVRSACLVAVGCVVGVNPLTLLVLLKTCPLEAVECADSLTLGDDGTCVYCTRGRACAIEARSLCCKLSYLVLQVA